MPGPGPSRIDTTAGRAPDLLDSVVSRVLAAALTLEAAIDGPPQARAQHISEVLRGLDEVVREVRDHVFAEQRRSGQDGHALRPRPDLRERAELSTNHAASLTYRMESLRQRVIQTASSLQVAAAESASLLEQRNDLLEPPTRIDLPTEIKRWRDFADQARQVAERLEHLRNQ